MKILIYSLNFAPEPTGIGKYSYEMAEWLSEKNEVRVICSQPYYPYWKIFDGFDAASYTHQLSGKIKVNRCPIWVPAKPSGLKRILHLVSFALSSFPVLMMQVRWRPDIVWVCAPSLACTPAVLLASKMARATSWVHVHDYEVDVAFRMGLVRGHYLKKSILWLEKCIYRKFDAFSTISRKMLEVGLKKGVDKDKSYIFPNWVNTRSIHPSRNSNYRKQLKISDETIIALFSGTLAAKQDLLIIPRAAKELSARSERVQIIICGDGMLKSELARECEGLQNVLLLPLQPKERMHDLMALADIHLLPQDPGVADLVMPSKLGAMLSSGKPVVSSAKEGSEVAEVLSTCGLLTEPGSAVALAEAIIKLARNESLRLELGASARRFAEHNLSLDAILSNFMDAAKRLREKRNAISG